MPDLSAYVAGWDTFYVIVGSSAAALTGLMFVVISLGAEQAPGTLEAIRAWGTPTVVHFGAALLLSALLTTPGHTILTLSLAVGVCGVIGLGFLQWVRIQAGRQHLYRPIAADWRWHRTMPIVAYLTLVAGAAALWWRPGTALAVMAAGVLLLLYIGIHNAWDAVLWNAVGRKAAGGGGGGGGHRASSEP